MRQALERIETAARGDSPIHRLDARWKIVGTLAFVFGLGLLPIDAWRPMFVLALVLAFLLGLSAIPPGMLFRRWLALAPVVVVLAILVTPGHPATARLGAPIVGLAILGRNAMAVLAVLLLAHTTAAPRLIAGLGRLGMPTVVLSTLQVMSRYLYVLADQADRMGQARRSRTFRRSGPLDWRLNSGLIASLLLRSIERGERVHAAMLARGFDGRVRSLDDPDPR